MIRRLPALVLVVLLVCLETFPLYANDIWMHLLLGRDTLASGIPHWETYSYTATGRPFVYHEWLAGVLFHLLHALGGVTGLLLLQPAAALAIAWFLYRTARSLGGDADVSVLVAGIGIYAASFRLFLRPHLLALPLLAAFLWLLERFRRRGGVAAPLALIGIQILWTNLHGSFPEGVVLAALYAGGEMLRRAVRRGEPSPAPTWALLALPVALTAASAVNPYGWNLVRVVAAHPVAPMFRAHIYEYFPTFGEAFRGTRMFVLYVGWLVLLGIATWLGRRRLDPAHLAPVAAFGVLAAWMNRGIADFVVVSAPWIAAGLSAGLRAPGRRAWIKPVAVASALGVLTAATVGFGYRFDARTVRRLGWGIDRFTPVGSADYLEDVGVRGNVFCSFPHGSYLAYRFAPAVRVVFDSRMIPYGEAIYQEYAVARRNLEAFRHHLERYQVDAVHLGFRLDGSPAIHRYLFRSPEWGLVHFDDEVVVYLRRTPATVAQVDRDRMTCVHPVLFDEGGIPPEEAACWEAETRRLLARDPGEALPRFLLAAALGAQGRPHEALAETDAIVASGDAPAFVHHLRARLFDEIGESARAREETEAAARLEGE